MSSYFKCQGIYCQVVECQENVCRSGTASRRRKFWQSAIFHRIWSTFPAIRQKKYWGRASPSGMTALLTHTAQNIENTNNRAHAINNIEFDLIQVVQNSTGP